MTNLDSIFEQRFYGKTLPIIKLALQKSPERLIFASLWSPPAWMKDSGEFGGGSLKAEHYPARSYNAWVIMLDEHRQPNRGPHSASATCVELLDDGSVRYNFDYFMQGQFIRYIKREAVCVGSSKPELPIQPSFNPRQLPLA